jgi:hypothetical protein
MGLLSAPGGVVTVNSTGGSILDGNPPGPPIGTSINLAGVDADNTLQFPLTVPGQIFWNGALVWPLAPVPGGVGAAVQAALQQGEPGLQAAARRHRGNHRSRQRPLPRPAPTPSEREEGA